MADENSMAATETLLPDRPRFAPSPLGKLLAMIGTRGLDQFALGAASLLIARRTGTEDFAPFATIFILYALTAQIGDGGLAFAILRTPSDKSIATATRVRRLGAGALMAVACAVVGLIVGGVAGTVVAIGGATLVTGPAVYVGRAALQWSGATGRLARGEAAGAFAFLVAVTVVVRDADDLLLFGLICIGKHVVEVAFQGWTHVVFARSGSPVRASGIFVSQVVTYVAANVDYVIVGALLGAEALSVYAIGFRLASAFSSVVAAPLTRTAFVEFANTDDAQVQHDRLVRQILGFGSLGIVVTGGVAVVLPTILGPEWLDTRLVTAVLGLALPWRLLLGPVVALGLTTGRALRVIGWEITRTVALVVAIVAGSTSIDRVAAAVAAATILTISWSYRRATAAAGIRSAPALGWGGLVAALAAALVIAF
jgi:PST family polysaccharide transporter